MENSEPTKSSLDNIIPAFLWGLFIGAALMSIFTIMCINREDEHLKPIAKLIPTIQMNVKEKSSYQQSLSDYTLGNEEPLHSFFAKLAKTKQGKIKIQLPEKKSDWGNPVLFKDPHLIWYNSETLVLVADPQGEEK